MTRFVFATTTMLFPCDPIRPVGRRCDLRQVRDVDSNGDTIVYGKGVGVALYRLTFPRVDAAARIALSAFVVQQLRGVRNLFTWYDHDDTPRTVRLGTSFLRFVPTGPDRYRLEIQLEELL